MKKIPLILILFCLIISGCCSLPRAASYQELYSFTQEKKKIKGRYGSTRKFVLSQDFRGYEVYDYDKKITALKEEVEKYISAHPELSEAAKNNLRQLKVSAGAAKEEVKLLLGPPDKPVRQWFGFPDSQSHKPVRQWFGFPYKPEGNGLSSDRQSHKVAKPGKENGAPPGLKPGVPSAAESRLPRILSGRRDNPAGQIWIYKINKSSPFFILFIPVFFGHEEYHLYFKDNLLTTIERHYLEQTFQANDADMDPLQP